MALIIENHETERMVRELAEKTGLSIEEVVLKALQEQLKREEALRQLLKTE